MEIQSGATNKKRYFKFIAGFFGIIAGIFILYGVGMWGWHKYDLRNQKEKLQKAMEDNGIQGEIQTKKFTRRDYEQAMADTYGGKTPQETLQLFVDAVEKEDFELAIKYFVIDDEERAYLKERLVSLQQKGLLYIYLRDLREALKNPIEYSNNQTMASIHKPIVIVFFKYPNNFWKISGF
ncbi:MAG: hypothetical protein AAB405_01145 [Patescibacteria group bacterium]